MGKMKIRLKTILIIFGAIIALPLLGYIGLCVKAFYLNMNPDHVDLQKGGWVKLMHFTTDTRTDKRKTLVEIYGKSINKPNAGNFLIVRPGLLPFGITAISPIYNANHLWRKNYLFLNANTTTIIKGAGIENGATIIFSTHNMDEAEEVCDKVAIMNAGDIAVIGSVAELKEKTNKKDATLEDAFVFFAGNSPQTEGNFREIRRTRQTEQRLG